MKLLLWDSIDSLTIAPEDLKFYNYNLEDDWEAGEFVLMAGRNSRDVKTVQVAWMK